MPALNIPIDTITAFMVGLLNTPSPTGYTNEAIRYVSDAFAALGFPDLDIQETSKGALFIHIAGESHVSQRALAAHVDTLGLMVKEIKSNGRLKTTMLGGYMWNAVEFEGVTVRAYDGRLYRGTVLPANPSVHVNRDISDAKRTGDLMEVRLDAKVESADDVKELGIQVGDFIFLDPRVEVTDTGFIRSRHLDDKASVACIYGALLALKEAGLRPAQDTIIYISNYEEVGHGGAGVFPDDLDELLVVDMGAMGPGQTTDEYSVSICAKDSSGPYHFEMTKELRELATANDIPFQVDIYPYYGSDGTAYWHAGGQARVALIGPGVDASHAYERTHQDSVHHTAHLIAQYLLKH